MKSIFFCIALLSLAACASQKTSFSNAKVTSQSSEEPSKLCQNFTLTHQEVLVFFGKANEVSAMDLHSQYDYLPCYVRGTIFYEENSASGKANCDFVIRAGGTAELSCNNEEPKLYGCKTCSSLLKDKPQKENH